MRLNLQRISSIFKLPQRKMLLDWQAIEWLSCVSTLGVICAKAKVP